jgi:hypothetical protein
MIFGHPDVRRAAALKQIKAWVAARVPVTGDAVLVVNELRCTEAGCPPFEVVVAVLRPRATPWQLRIHKAAVEVSEGDVDAAVAAGGSL